MFDQILVPLDRSPGAERVVMPAARLASRLGARLLLWGATFDEMLLGDVETYLRDLLGHVAAGQGAIRATWSHDPAAAIAELVGEQRSTLVVMATHARSRIGEAALGSVSYGVVALASCPVLFVGPHCSTEAAGAITTVVAPLDGSPRAETALGVAAGFAHDGGFPLTLLQVAPPGQPDEGPAGYLRAAAGSYGPGIATVVLQGPKPADAIVNYASQAPGTCLALCTHGEGGSGYSTLGRVVASVLRQAPCPVLVIPAS